MSENTANPNIDSTIDNDEEQPSMTLPPHFDVMGPELHLTEVQSTLGTDDDGNHLMVANITVKGLPSIVRTLVSNIMASPFALLLLSDPEYSIYAAAASEGRLGIADEEEEETQKPKRGPGRPRKNAEATVQSMAGLGDGEALEEPVKRGPGRPRKHPLPAADTQPAAAPQVAAPVVQQPPAPPQEPVSVQTSLFDEEPEAPAAAPAVNTALGFNPPKDILDKTRVGDVIRYLAQDAHAKGISMEQAVPQIRQWFMDNFARTAALRSSSADQVSAMMDKGLRNFVESNWPKA